MRSVGFVVALLLASITSTIASPDAFDTLDTRREKGKNGTMNGKGNSLNKECRQMETLTRFTEFAANQTKLDALVAKGKLNQTQVDKIKAKAQEDTTKLQTLNSNTTLVGQCAVVNAHRKDIGMCFKMRGLQRLANLSSDQAAKDAFIKKKKFNDTQVMKLNERIGKASTMLKDMMSNTTLVNLCAQMQKERKNNATSAASGAKPATTGGAATLATQTLPFVAGVGAVFALFL